MKLLRKILFILVIIAAGLAAWGLGLIQRSSEPVYRGHVIGYWMRGYDKARGPGGRYEYQRREEALSAVRSAGTNAIPIFIRWIKADGRPVRRALASEWGSEWSMDNSSLHRMAWWGFEFESVAGHGKAAAAALIAAMPGSSAESRELELNCLVRMGADDNVLLPALRGLLGDPRVGRAAATAIIWNYPAEASNVYRRYPELRSMLRGSTNQAR